MNILVIEPNSILGGLYQKLFEARGHTVRIAHNGQYAIELCDGESPDIILLELQLITCNGIAFLHELRSYTEWQDIPIILNTLVPTNRLSLKLRKRFGIIEHLYKPAIGLQGILDAVERVQVFNKSSP